MQKWAHLLKVLQMVVLCDIKIFLNPQSKLSEVPIKRYKLVNVLLCLGAHACAARAYGSLPVCVHVCVFQLYLLLP